MQDYNCIYNYQLRSRHLFGKSDHPPFSPLSARRSLPLAALDLSGKMGNSHAQRQMKGHRMGILAEFMSATINAFEVVRNTEGQSKAMRNVTFLD